MSNPDTADAIKAVNHMLDITTPMALSNETQLILRGEPYNVATMAAEHIRAAVNELLRLQAIDKKNLETANEDRDAQETRLAEVTRSYSEYRNTVIGDFERISEALNSAADDNNLCGEYEEAIDEVNKAIRGPYELTARSKEFTVTITVTTCVSARNEEQAQELVQEDLDSYVDFSYADFHVEED